jgi:hypothetical protein
MPLRQKSNKKGQVVMNFKKLSTLAAAAGAILLVGCNLFNPNGAEESSCDSGNAECYITLGQSLIQQKNFSAAMNAYSTAMAIDSSKSEAYLGYATAVTFKYNMQLGSLLDDMQAASNSNPTAFIEHDDAVLTSRLQMSSEVVKVLARLADRDSLTRWYQYLTDTTQQSKDPYFTARKTFITNYLAAHPSGSRSATQFPLTDRKKKFENNVFQYAPHLLLYTILHTYDLDGNNIFTESDRAMRTLLSSTGSGLGDITELAEQMKTDTVLQQSVNNKILELQSGLGGISELLTLFNVGADGADTLGAQAQSQKQIDSAITSLGGTLVFYQFGDKIDNDGDGCIDEEIPDQKDNDGDGFVDEDARVLTGNGILVGPTATGPADSVDNDRNGRKDAADAGENLFGGATPAIADYLTFVVLSGQQENWIVNGARKDQSNMDFRVRLQADSLAVRLTPGARPVPPLYAAKLDSAKTFVGGCWRNY